MVLHDIDAPHVQEIRRLIGKLDEVAIKMEVKWGHDGLVPYVSKKTAEKWHKQKEKLDEAIQSQCTQTVETLVDGTIRGYEVLEAEAEANGYTPHKPEVWNFTHPDSGRKYRICKTPLDAARMVQEGVVVYTLCEVIRILEASQLVNVVKETWEGAKVKKVVNKKDDEFFDWGKGDELPPEF